MPHAIKLDRKYAKKGLRVVLVHTQQRIDLAKFMYERFPQNEALVTADNPVPTGATANLKLPRAALVGCDGKLLAVGHRNEVGKQIDKLIPKELARMRQGWGADEVIAKARAAFYVDRMFADARATLEQHRPDEDAAKKDAEEALVELHRRFYSVMSALRWRLDRGHIIETEKELKDLAGKVKGYESWEKRVAELLARIDSESGQLEMKLEKQLQKIEKSARKGVKKGMPDKLRKLAEGRKDLAVARRALHLAGIWNRVLAD